MRSYTAFFVAALLLLLITSCDGLKRPGSIFKTSEREKYERNFPQTDSVFSQWKSNFQSAEKNRLKIEDGFTAVVFSDSTKLTALGYSLELKKGDLLIIETKVTTPEPKIFVDIIDSLSANNRESGLMKGGRFTKAIENTGSCRIIIQPEIEYQGSFELKIYTQPSIGFPVAGKGNRDVQSFWGASRDGGVRSHEGVDIFASKGTPVVAVAEGVITRTGNQGLGGKQVWLRDKLIGNSFYYAHLDSIMASAGLKVKKGDTLGLVGNTGNAAGGASHLHFGIYSAGGAADPYPYIRKREVPPSTKSLLKLKDFKFVKSKTIIRSGAGLKFEVLTKTESQHSINILAFDGSWYHIITSDLLEGWVSSSALQK